MTTCDLCTKPCPRYNEIKNLAEGRMFAMKELVALYKKIDNGTLVEVVRCKDCKHRDPEDHKCDCGENERQGCPFPVDDDYFCKYGSILHAMEGLKMNEREILTKAVLTFGQLPQIIVAIEEMSELTKELCKSQRGASNRDHIAEEIADVEIMLAQLKLVYNIAPSVENWRQSKLKRLAQTLGVENYAADR